MMRQCQMMQQEHAQGGDPAARWDPAQHGGMSHEEMMRHCQMMQQQGQQSAPQAEQPQHQH